MDKLPAAILVGTVLLLLVAGRMYAARKVAAGDAGYLWILFAVPLLIGGVLMWAGLVMIYSSPVAGAFMLLFGVVWAIAAWRLVQSSSKGVRTATTPESRFDALFPVMSKFLLTTTVLGLLIGIAGGLLLLTGSWR